MSQNETCEEYVSLENIQYCETVNFDVINSTSENVDWEEKQATKFVGSYHKKRVHQSSTAFSNGSQHFTVRMNSQDSILDSDTDFDSSQRSDDRSEFGDDIIAKIDLNDEPTSFLTPSKSGSGYSSDSFWSPTANLKILLKAASPDIRNRELQLKEASENLARSTLSQEAVTQLLTNRTMEDEDSVDYSESFSVYADSERGEKSKRKEKSLSLLCKRFLQQYPESPGTESKIEISLDDSAAFLAVTRRRVYDIINVLESVEYVSRFAKNKYLWHGRSRLISTLSRLKAQALHDGSCDRLNEMIERQFSSSTLSRQSSAWRLSDNKENCLLTPTDLSRSTSRRSEEGIKKSLFFLSQRFLMLFLVAENKPLGLDLLAKILIGCDTLQKDDIGKYKTTLRRLYDIANILSSLRLIEKTRVLHASEKSRKPAFIYIGPLVPAAAMLDNMNFQLSDRRSVKANKRPASCLPAVAGGTKRSLSKYLSLDEICRVTENDRNRLCTLKPQDPVCLQSSHPSIMTPGCNFNAMGVNYGNVRVVAANKDQGIVSATSVQNKNGVRNLFFRARSDSAINSRHLVPSMIRPVRMGASNEMQKEVCPQTLITFRMKQMPSSQASTDVAGLEARSQDQFQAVGQGTTTASDASSNRAIPGLHVLQNGRLIPFHSQAIQSNQLVFVNTNTNLTKSEATNQCDRLERAAQNGVKIVQRSTVERSSSTELQQSQATASDGSVRLWQSAPIWRSSDVMEQDSNNVLSRHQKEMLSDVCGDQSSDVVRGRQGVMCRPLVTSNIANTMVSPQGPNTVQHSTPFQRPGQRILVIRRLNSKDN